MKNQRKRQLTHFAVIVIVLVLLYLLNNVAFRKSAEEQVSELISHHEGAIVFFKSGTERDRPFKEALSEIRTKLKGKAGIVITSMGKEKKSGSGTTSSSPTLIILDAHGNQVYRFVDSLDRKVLDELVLQLVTHHH